MIGDKSETSELSAERRPLLAEPSVQQVAGAPQLKPSAARSQPTGLAERIAVGIDATTFGAIYRTAIGFFALPILSNVVGEHGADRVLVPFLLAALLSLRIAPVLFRRFVPFSDWARQIWAERRQLGKRYDSYQWQKLLWVGIGLALFTALFGEATTPRIVVSAACILSGAIGLARWQLVVGPRHYAGRQVTP